MKKKVIIIELSTMDHIFPEELVKRIMDAARKENTRCPLSSEDCEKFYDHDQIQNTNNTIHKFDLQSLNKKVQKIWMNTRFLNGENMIINIDSINTS